MLNRLIKLIRNYLNTYIGELSPILIDIEIKINIES